MCVSVLCHEPQPLLPNKRYISEFTTHKTSIFLLSVTQQLTPPGLMWNHIPLDLLAHILSFLPPDSLLRARSSCKHWLSCPPPLSASHHHHHPPWLLAVPARSAAVSCLARNPSSHRWHSLPLSFCPSPIRIISPLPTGLLLCKLAASPTLRLLLLNPFTRHLHPLPDLTLPRSNPAVAVVSDPLRVYVAGGASGAGYEATVEVYDSAGWKVVGAVPAEVAVRLTVWTPNESVEAEGVVYWMTSARAYSIVGYEVASGRWREVRAPMAELLEWAALLRRRKTGRLGLVGGAREGEGTVWEMTGDGEWAAVEAVPVEMGRRLWRGSRERWAGTKCVGSEEAVYLYRELGEEMLVWSGGVGAVSPAAATVEEGEWSVVAGCSGGGGGLAGISVKAAVLHPSLSPTCILCLGSNNIGARGSHKKNE